MTWASNVRGFQEVYYKDIWNGIDIRYYRFKGALKYDLILHPGADSDMIRMKTEGCTKLAVSGDSIILTTPMLTILSVIIGIAGSFLVGLTYLNIAVVPFFQEVTEALIFKDIITGLVKSFIFAWIIVIVGAYYGFNVKGGSEGVGRATTASVVTSIFLVVLADSILGLIFYFG